MDREFLHDSFEIDYAEYPARVTYDWNALDGTTIKACEIDLGGGVYAKVNEDNLEQLVPELERLQKLEAEQDMSNVA
jgi:hypothetical protein